jgi:hypothetical protein
VISAEELNDWINTLPGDANVYIDDGGLALRSGDNWIEIGGSPLSLPEAVENMLIYLEGMGVDTGLGGPMSELRDALERAKNT